MKKSSKKFSVVLILIIIFGSGGYLLSHYLIKNPSQTAEDLWVAVYHPCYQWNAIEGEIPWDQISHLILGYLHLNETSETEFSLKIPNGFYGGSQLWFEQAAAFIKDGHEKDVKVTCMLGGAGSNPDLIWNKATSPTNIQKFAENIQSILEPLGFDGIDLDWENEVVHTQLVDLAKELRNIWPEAIITIPTGPTGQDAEELEPAQNYIDAFMPMTYMGIQQWGGWVIPVPLTPLYGGQRPETTPNPYSVNLTLQKWQEAGVPSSKIVMGVGGFGLVWGDSNGDGQGPIKPYSNENLNGGSAGETSYIATDNAVTWSWVKNTVEHNSKFIEAWDDVSKCTYWHAPATDDLIQVKNVYGTDISVSIIFYETSRSITEKVSYCRQEGMKGMMFWTLSQMMDGASCPILDAIKF
ncbi:glycoside hydrolase family 18 protein [Candidatus Lokiarchaeum ossiferum]|uniref:glycoside hydrolase family 18 protein n=1 Tax=Candidatus Lokiarchaeum ossiferum TaxID=2951803 RepID=UPI00352CB2C6